MIPAKQQTQPPAATIEDLLIRGNLAALSEEQRTEYYQRVCQSLGLNPLTQPFSYIVLNGKLTLYANRACADQLRKINGISVEIVSQEQKDGLLTIHVKARDKTGRIDEDIGVVPMGNLKGEAAANAALKAVTKAKRRVTLSISGLGYLDETEVEDIPAATKQEPEPIAHYREPESGPYQAPIEPAQKLAVEIPKFSDGTPNWQEFGSLLWKRAQACEDKAEIFDLREANKESLELMKTHWPNKHRVLTKQIDELLNESS